MDPTAQCNVTVYDHGNGTTSTATRTVIVERPLVIGLNGAADYTIMRTPGNDRELATGFLLTEGLINSLDDIMMLMECPETPDSIAVRTTAPAAAAEPAARNLVVNSSCGLCGRIDLATLLERLGSVKNGPAFSRSLVYDIPAKVRPGQTLFRATGATHAAALFDTNGNIFVTREDVGRHNAADKAIGAAMLRGASVTGMGLFLSGRASLELVIKAARAAIPLLLSVSAPTLAAITTADKLGITLAGFAREQGFTIYTRPERIIPS